MASNNQDEQAKTIGNREYDNYTSDNIYGILDMLKHHVHSVTKVYPTLANNVTLTGGAGAWQLGNFIEVVPANTITDWFDIHWVVLVDPSVQDNYQVELYQGDLGSEELIAQIKVTRDTNQGSTGSVPIMTPIIPANTRISAKLATESGGNDTLDIAVLYHEY